MLKKATITMVALLGVLGANANQDAMPDSMSSMDSNQPQPGSTQATTNQGGQGATAKAQHKDMKKQHKADLKGLSGQEKKDLKARQKLDRADLKAQKTQDRADKKQAKRDQKNQGMGAGTTSQY
jgi:hypothetical protein